MVDKQHLLDLMAEIMDPEIPVINIVELGIVRGIEDSTPPNIIITPTYVGCPATDMISEMIREKLDTAGHEDIRIKNQLSPAWTTEWITASAREKLRIYGIDPPGDHPPTCPRCGSANTKLVSEFGSTPCKAFHTCKDCLEPFDRFKCH
ncbi:MAG: phenylacetate-CoA oxygenase subunit PaaJ [Robiginitomaculum sp.]|nr:phenylacetate-CoA oxygenase subunit PaaJ [Robiginitomaculum sp.]